MLLGFIITLFGSKGRRITSLLRYASFIMTGRITSLWNNVGSEVGDCFVVALLAMTEIGCVFFMEWRVTGLRDCFVVALLAMTEVGCVFFYETLCDGVKGLLRCCTPCIDKSGCCGMSLRAEGVAISSILISSSPSR